MRCKCPEWVEAYYECYFDGELVRECSGCGAVESNRRAGCNRPGTTPVECPLEEREEGWD